MNSWRQTDKCFQQKPGATDPAQERRKAGENKKIGITGNSGSLNKLLYAEAFNHLYDEPKEFELRDISEIMNTAIKGWRKCKQHRYSKYGVQWSWERDPDARDVTDGQKNDSSFLPVPEQMKLPFD